MCFHPSSQRGSFPVFYSSWILLMSFEVSQIYSEWGHREQAGLAFEWEWFPLTSHWGSVLILPKLIILARWVEMKQLKWKTVIERPTPTQEKWVMLSLVCPWAKLQRDWSLFGEAPGHPSLGGWLSWGTKGLLLDSTWSISPRSVLGYSCFTGQLDFFFFFSFFFRNPLHSLFVSLSRPAFDFGISKVKVSLTV